MGVAGQDNDERQNNPGAGDIGLLYYALDKGDVESAVIIINAIGDRKNLQALEPLIILLEYNDIDVRCSAALALGKLGDLTAVEPLIGLLKDESNDVKESTAIALGELGDGRALRPLENMGTAVVNPGLMNAVGNAIEQINKKNIRPDVYPSTQIAAPPVAVVNEPAPVSQVKAKRGTKNVLIIALSIFIIVILLVGVGAVAYTLLFPPVWSEQLPFKNSTGQSQSIVMYRNATDVTYDNLTRFLESNDIESLVLAEPDYKCVEFAVLLHDDAEMAGINCTVVGTELSGGIAGHALDVFYTTDRGVVYVDPSSMNVSADDFGGIPYDRVILLRDTWVQEFPLINANGERISAKAYRNALKL